MTVSSQNRAEVIPAKGKKKEAIAGNSRGKYSENSDIQLCEPIIIHNEYTSEPEQIAGTWSIKFSIDSNNDLFPEKFWLSDKYLESTGLRHTPGILSLDNWLECIVDEDKAKMRKHMLSIQSTDTLPATLIYSVNTDGNSVKHFFSIASSIIDDANGSLHLRGVDWELNNTEMI